MHSFSDQLAAVSRRQFLGRSAAGIGSIALGSLMAPGAFASPAPAALPLPHLPRAKRVIYLFQSGGPSQLDLFDPKPQMTKLRGKDLPESVRMGQRLTGMTSGQKSFPVANSIFKFAANPACGTEVSDLMPHVRAAADKICFIRSLHTDQINHDPAITFFQTGFQLAGRPSIGSWLSYGLGSHNRDLPAYVVLVSRGTGRPSCQPLYDRLWGSGFLPTTHAGVKLRSASDPVLYLSNPAGVDRPMRRQLLDELGSLNQHAYAAKLDPEIETRIAQYELAYRMQMSVPDLRDISGEPDHVLDLYGPNVRKPGTFAANALLARRLAERDVRFIQLFHMGWDQHGNLPRQIKGQCADTDQPTAALIHDLDQRGLLEDTLVVWGGEFGRTVYSQGQLTPTDYGRDHHPRCFSVFLAGGGVRGGITHGSTDDFSYNVADDPVSIHDLHATILHQLGVDHTRLTFRFQGRDYRLTDVFGNVVSQILA